MPFTDFMAPYLKLMLLIKKKKKKKDSHAKNCAFVKPFPKIVHVRNAMQIYIVIQDVRYFSLDHNSFESPFVKHDLY